MTECEKENIYLLMTTIFTGFLWILSEIIGSSKCSAGGVLEFVVHGYCVVITRETRDTPRDSVLVTTVEETTLLIDSENVE